MNDLSSKERWSRIEDATARIQAGFNDLAQHALISSFKCQITPPDGTTRTMYFLGSLTPPDEWQDDPYPRLSDEDWDEAMTTPIS